MKALVRWADEDYDELVWACRTLGTQIALEDASQGEFDRTTSIFDLSTATVGERLCSLPLVFCSLGPCGSGLLTASSPSPPLLPSLPAIPINLTCLSGHHSPTCPNSPTCSHNHFYSPPNRLWPKQKQKDDGNILPLPEARKVMNALRLYWWYTKPATESKLSNLHLISLKPTYRSGILQWSFNVRYRIHSGTFGVLLVLRTRSGSRRLGEWLVVDQNLGIWKYTTQWSE